MSTVFFLFFFSDREALEGCWKTLLHARGAKGKKDVNFRYHNTVLTEGDSREESPHAGWKGVHTQTLPE